MTKIKPPIKTTIRVPPDLYDLAMEAASHDDRSLNNFIVQALREKLARGNWLDDVITTAKRSKDDGK